MQYKYSSYGQISRNTIWYREHNDCSVIATALACNVRYAESHDTLTEIGRKKRRGTSNPIIMCAVKRLGYRLDNITDEITAKTVMKLKDDPAVASGRFLVFVRGHVLCVRDGEVLDWTQNRRHRIKKVYKVIKRD